jgi:glycosyltransferase 2 family protein
MSQEAPNEPKSRFRQWGNLLAIAIAVILLIWVVRSISFEEVFQILQTADFWWLGVAACLNLVMLALMAYRWYILYEVEPTERPDYLSLLQGSFIAIFFNNFLPSTIGGDGYRIYHASKVKKTGGLTGALSIVFVDRVIGLIGLMTVSFIAVFFYDGQLIEGVGDLRIWIALITLGLLTLLWLGLNERNYERANKLIAFLRLPKQEWLQVKLETVKKHLAVYAHAKHLLFASLIISIVLRTIWLLSCYFLGIAFHFDAPLISYFVLIPIIETLRMIPLTIQGLGVRESLFVLLFGQVGLSNSEASVLAVMVYLFLNINGLVGGILYLAGMVKASTTKAA